MRFPSVLSSPVASFPLWHQLIQVEGVGKDSIPTAMDFGVVDHMMQFHDKDCFQMCRRVAAEEGMLVGGSSGLNLTAAAELSKTAADGDVIVAVLPDSGIKYLSKIFNDEWMEEKGFMDEADKALPADAAEAAVREAAASASSAAPSSSQAAPQSADEENLEEFLRGVGNTLSSYVASGPDMSQPVVRLTSPDEMAIAFEHAGTSMDLEAGAGPVDTDSLQSILETTLELSVRTHHPYFFNQLYSAADPMAIAADWAAVAANTNVHTYEVAPVFTVVEQKVLDKLASSIGGRFSEGHEGLFVPGGSLANTYGMHLARHRAIPDVNAKGLVGAPQLVAFTSAQSHYSYKKASMLIGLGSDNLVAVDCDETGAMLPGALAEAVKQARAEGKVPFFVGATAGTTVTGAFDPFDAIADVCEEEGLYMHVDGAWGAAVLLSADPSRRALMSGAERADSLTWNAHKLMGAPLQCSAFLTSNPGEELKKSSDSQDSPLLLSSPPPSLILSCLPYCSSAWHNKGCKPNFFRQENNLMFPSNFLLYLPLKLLIVPVLSVPRPILPHDYPSPIPSPPVTLKVHGI